MKLSNSRLKFSKKGESRVQGCLEIVPSVWGVWMITVKEKKLPKTKKISKNDVDRD